MSLALLIVASVASLFGWGLTWQWCARLRTEEEHEAAEREARARSSRRRREEKEERQVSAAHAAVRAHRHAIEVTAAQTRRVPKSAFVELLPRVYEDGEEPTLVSRRW